MKKFSAVLFDLDNTAYLYNSCHQAGLFAAYKLSQDIKLAFQNFEDFSAAYYLSRKQAKKRISGKAASHCRLLYFKKLLENIYGKTRSNDTILLHEAYWNGYFSAMVREPGSREVLDRLRERCIPTAWVTNFTTERQFRKLECLGLTDSVDYLVTSEESGSEKPSPECIESALERIGLSPSLNIVLVGDNDSEDGGAAARAGISFIWYRRKKEALPVTISPIYIVESWWELGDILL